MRDTGTGCTKDSYGRGAGGILKCGKSLEQNGLLCYPKCKDGFKGVGPVCWGTCPASLTPCGIFCLKDTSCGMKILNILMGVADLIMDVVSLVPGAQGLKAVKVAAKAGMKAATKIGAKVAAKVAKKAGTKIASKAGKKFASKAATKGAKKAGKKAGETFTDKLKDFAKDKAKGAFEEAAWKTAIGSSPSEIGEGILEAVVPGYSLGKEFVMPHCDTVMEEIRKEKEKGSK